MAEYATVGDPFTWGSQGQDPSPAGQAQTLDQILNQNPTLQNTPGLALDAASSGIPNAGTVAALGVQAQAAVGAQAEHAQTYGSGGVWGSIWKHVKDAASTGLEWLGKPLHEVQSDYKFIHAVYQRNGLPEGTLATLGVAGGAIGGGFLGGGVGAAAGTDLSGMLERNTFGRFWQHDAKAFQDSQDPNYQVSFGRDFSNVLGQIPGLHALRNTDSGAGMGVSGTADALFDLGLDPTVVAGKATAAVKAGKFVATYADGTLKGGVIGARAFPALNQFFERNSYRIFSPDQIQSLYANRLGGAAYRRALGQLADMSAGDVVARYPELGALAGDIGRASTPEAVHGLFMQVAADASDRQAIMQGVLPSRTLLRAPFSAAAERLRQTTTTDLQDAPGLVLPHRAIDTATGESTGVVLPLIARPLSPQAWKAAVGQKVRTFSGYMPYNVDKDTLAASGKVFQADDPMAGQIVYRAAKFSMNEKAARDITTRFLNASTPDEQKLVMAQLGLGVMKAAGIPDDPALVKAATDQVAQYAFGPAASNVYGFGHVSGEDVSNVLTPQGTASLGLGAHQASTTFAIPNFQALRSTMRSLGTLSNLYGKTEDFLATRYIKNVFKPFALLTAGFGFRVAASEAIPELMRNGALDYLKARIQSSAAKMNYRLDPGEDEHVLSAMAAATSGAHLAHDLDPVTQAKNALDYGRYKIANGLRWLARNPDDAELAAHLVMSGDGHIVQGINNAGHGTADDPVEFARDGIWMAAAKGARHPLAPAADWTALEGGSPNFDGYWLAQLQKWSQEKSGQLIAKDVLDNVRGGMPEDMAWEDAAKKESARIAGAGSPNDPYANERNLLARYKLQSPDDFASQRVDNLRGMLTGKNKEFHSFLAEKMAAGEKPTADDLVDLNSLQKPQGTIGHEVVPRIGPNIMQRIANTGFEKVVSPVINYISREPMFFNAVKNEMRTLQYQIDNGLLDYDSAVRLAKQRATLSMLPQIHNTALRSQFSELARNYLPFYFAQEQAMRRAGTLVYRNPAAFRQYQLMYQAMSNPAFTQTDSSGQQYLMMPYIGEWGMGAVGALKMLGFSTVPGLPVSVRGDMQSLQTVLPELNMPGVSTLVSVPLNQLVSAFPELARPAQKVLGRGFGTGPVNALIPWAPLRSIWNGIDANDMNRSYANAVTSAMASAYYHNMMPGPNASAADKQAFMDRIKNNARSIMFVKALLGAVSPLSPQVSAGTLQEAQFSDEFNKLVQQTGDYQKALQQFLAKHGDSAVSYTVTHSESNVPGAKYPYTNTALNWIQSNEGLLRSPFATGAAFLIPQATDGGKDQANNQAMHDELLKMSLRATRTPEEFMKAVYIAAGDNAISDAETAHKTAMVQYQNNPALKNAESKNWSNYVNQMALWNPIWAEDYMSPDRTLNARKAVADLRAIFSQGLAPNDPQARSVYGLLQDYEAHRIQLASYGNTSAGAPQRDQLHSQWDSYLDMQAKLHPELQTVIRSVFKRLETTTNA